MKELKKSLKKYKEAFEELETTHSKNIRFLEKKMNEELKRKHKCPELSFFYVEGECVGVGAERYEDRKDFDLIQWSDIE